MKIILHCPICDEGDCSFDTDELYIDSTGEGGDECIVRPCDNVFCAGAAKIELVANWNVREELTPL